MHYYKKIKLYFIVFSLLRLDTMLAILQKNSKHKYVKVFKKNQNYKLKRQKQNFIDVNDDCLVKELEKPYFTSPVAPNSNCYSFDYEALSNILYTLKNSLDNKNS